jgi:hypothetical protein
MNRDHREWTDRFTEYLSGEVAGPERVSLEEHVADCGACREALAQISEVVAMAGDAPQLEPPRDLWPGIAASTGAGVRKIEGTGGSDVIALPTAQEGEVAPTSAHRRARLAMAAVLLIAVSSTTTWWITSSTAPSPISPGPSVPVSVSFSQASDELAPEGLADQLRVLEQFMVAAGETLDPATVLVLERNLNAIETAISDSRGALALDPGNGFLIEHLDRMYRRKLLYLQDAVRVVEWSS